MDSNDSNPSKDSKETSPMSKPLKRKIDDEDLEKDQIDQNSCPLSPDQKKRMLTNKSLALIKVKSRTLPFALHENIGLSWFNALKDEFDKPYFLKLNNFLETERNSSVKIFPPHDQVWSWTHHFPMEETKVVILGQDPYHGPGQSEGLSFSVPNSFKHPPSLINIFKEIESDLNIPYPKSGNLIHWARQGVMLLNATLTVRSAEPGSHQKNGWETFTDALIQKISSKNSLLIIARLM